METKYHYFKRDISWLSFNHRVLLEAKDESLPIYERIQFIAIYTSNTEEFYRVRVGEHKAVANGGHSEGMTREEAHNLIGEITTEVNKQLEDRVYIMEHMILPALRKKYVIFYQSYKEVPPFQHEYVAKFFREEIFPYLQPVPVCKDRVKVFLRENRLYMAARVIHKETRQFEYFIMKVPYGDVPRFIELPKEGEYYYLMFIEDIIKANMQLIFPGYEMDSCYCCKISRDADILVDELSSKEGMLEQLKKKVKRRKIGAVCRFVYERQMPTDFLNYLVDSFDINRDELVLGDKHINLEDLAEFPNPNPEEIPPVVKPQPMRLNYLNDKQSIFNYVNKQDMLLHYPYHTFDHFIHFLYEAVHDPSTEEIMITQYRVAQHSQVINTLMSAAQNGKKVTVFVELKARFDEENNLATAAMMKQAGVNIIYSIPGLKVHAKVALVLRRNKEGHLKRSYAYISTGNFNEKTAKLYADTALITCRDGIVSDLYKLFRVLKQEIKEAHFKYLMVTRFNLLPKLHNLISFEKNEAIAGRKAHIVLKMNALQDEAMIEELYKASEAGVKIDLIVRGICCLIPGQPYSKNITVTRIVDSFLEHARVWYFYQGGKEMVWIGSPDWMKRNLYRRIEAVAPIFDPRNKQEIIDMLKIQLADNQKAVWVDEHLNNIFKRQPGQPPVRAQYVFYDYLKVKNQQKASEE